MWLLCCCRAKVGKCSRSEPMQEVRVATLATASIQAQAAADALEGGCNGGGGKQLQALDEKEPAIKALDEKQPAVKDGAAAVDAPEVSVWQEIGSVLTETVAGKVGPLVTECAWMSMGVVGKVAVHEWWGWQGLMKRRSGAHGDGEHAWRLDPVCPKLEHGCGAFGQMIVNGRQTGVPQHK